MSVRVCFCLNLERIEIPRIILETLFLNGTTTCLRIIGDKLWNSFFKPTIFRSLLEEFVRRLVR